MQPDSVANQRFHRLDRWWRRLWRKRRRRQRSLPRRDILRAVAGRRMAAQTALAWRSSADSRQSPV